jgi:nitrate/nitrite-specific signal transduction histidine kinase
MNVALRLVAEGLQADVTRVIETVAGSDSLRVVAEHRRQPETLQTLEYTPEELSLVALAMRSERPVSSSDRLATAIRDGQSHFGVLAAYWKTSRKFDQHAIEFIQQVANLLAFAVGRTSAEKRLAESEQRYQRIARDITVQLQEERLNRIEMAADEAILAGNSATQVIRRLVHDVRRLTDADHASYLVPVDGADSVRIEVADGLYAEHEGRSVSVAGLGVARALSGGDPIITGSVDGDALQLLPDASVGSAIMVPVRTTAGSSGVLVLANRPGKAMLGDMELEVLGRLGRRAAVAIEYRRAHDELQRVAVMDDRARIARDLHDGIIQSLFAASMVVNQVRELEQTPNTTRVQLVRLERLIASSIEDLRQYVRHLTPPALSNSDLGTLVRQLVRDFQERTGIRCRVSLEPRALATVQGRAVDIVQIIRESLSNIARHASASSCAIKLRRDGERTTLEIRDDGRGLQRGHRRGFGLKNIVSRARFLGGEAAVTGEPGAGTVVRVILP